MKYALVYAVGASLPLPALGERAAAASAVLHALATDAEARSILSDPRVAVVSGSPHSGTSSSTAASHAPSSSLSPPPGEFYASRRVIPGFALDAALPHLHAAIARAVVARPSYELSWIGRLSRERKASLVEFVTAADKPAASILDPSDFANEGHAAAALALRGLLAYGVVAHSLKQRHLVDFGVAPPPRGRKRLAVPFRAADLPSERAELAHPDVAIVQTQISYFFSGLSNAQVMDAFRSLLGLGLTAQEQRYADCACHRSCRDSRSCSLLTTPAGVFPYRQGTRLSHLG